MDTPPEPLAVAITTRGVDDNNAAGMLAQHDKELAASVAPISLQDVCIDNVVVDIPWSTPDDQQIMDAEPQGTCGTENHKGLSSPPPPQHTPTAAGRDDFIDHADQRAHADKADPVRGPPRGTAAVPSHAVLPRQPLGLLHAQQYAAVSSLVRAVGRAAVDAEADGCQAVLSALVQSLLDRMQGGCQTGGNRVPLHLQVACQKKGFALGTA